MKNGDDHAFMRFDCSSLALRQNSQNDVEAQKLKGGRVISYSLLVIGYQLLGIGASWFASLATAQTKFARRHNSESIGNGSGVVFKGF